MVNPDSKQGNLSKITPPNIFQGRILKKFKITSDIEKIRVECPEIARSAKPGQFVNVKTTHGYSAFLRRPFSVNRVNIEQGWFDILYRILGSGTQSLSEQKEGQKLDLVGPLGNGFPSHENSRNGILVAGGLGIAPIEFLAQRLNESNFKAKLFWGNPSSDFFAYEKFLADLNVEFYFASDDGSAGFQGTVLDYLFSVVSDEELENSTIYTCGPDPMLQAFQKWIKGRKVKCLASLETVMACGFGVCLGCNVPRADGNGYFYVCKDGPVLDLRDIRFHD